MNAYEAIHRSIMYGEIGYCADTPDNRSILSIECNDQSYGANGIQDYWGETDDGQAWRVTLENER